MKITNQILMKYEKTFIIHLAANGSYILQRTKQRKYEYFQKNF